MTDKQKAIVNFIRDYTAEKGYAPSHLDIARWCGVSKQAVGCRIERLERNGFVRRSVGIPRSLRVVE